MWARAFLVAAVVATAGGVGSAGAAQPSGQAVAVLQSVEANGAAGVRTLAIDAPVYMGDLIKTDKVGQAQLKFLDNTRMVIGPNAQFTIDSFVFDNKTTAKKFSINVVRGAFRFITGVSRKQAYTITTPSAAIAVRGTQFDLSVDANGATNLALYEGSVRLCDKGVPRQCAVLAGRCSVLILSPDNKFQWVNDIAQRTAMLGTVFPYAFQQASLLPDFQVGSGACNVVDGGTPAGPGSKPLPAHGRGNIH